MRKLTKQERNVVVDKRPALEQLDQTGSVQLILSPFVHAGLNINEMTTCLFNSLTMQKVYLTNEKYAKFLTDLSVGHLGDDVKSLIELKFIVPESFDPEQVFDTVANSLSKKSLFQVSRTFWLLISVILDAVIVSSKTLYVITEVSYT